MTDILSLKMAFNPYEHNNPGRAKELKELENRKPEAPFVFTPFSLGEGQSSSGFRAEDATAYLQVWD